MNFTIFRIRCRQRHFKGSVSSGAADAAGTEAGGKTAVCLCIIILKGGMNLKNDASVEILRRLDQVYGRFDRRQVFTDFLYLTAYQISNRTDPVHLNKRLKLANEIWKKYTRQEAVLFAEMLGLLLDAISKYSHAGQLEDILGTIFEQLGSGSKAMGQDFTPASVCRLMAGLTGVPAEEKVVTLNEPSCGSGSMILAYAEMMQKHGRNYCSELVVLAQDLDIHCVLMAYIQLSLYGIPAVVLHGNTITTEEFDRWYTPIYILDRWVWRKPLGMTGKRSLDDEKLKVCQEPMYGLIRYPEWISIHKANVEEACCNAV